MSDTSWQKNLEEIIKARIQNLVRVSGGDINQSYQITTASKEYFLKVNPNLQALSMFQTEKQGLELLGSVENVQVPYPTRVVKLSQDLYGLLMPFYEVSQSSDAYWKDLAQQLSLIHRSTYSHFGLHSDNYIGTLTQKNDLFESWGNFYATTRILPIAKICRDASYLNPLECSSIERLCLRFGEIYPLEAPSLLHGDLWSGNILNSMDQRAIFIDPAIYYGHREMDIAMTQLFGGFSSLFLETYNSLFALAKGWESRLKYSQLYYLLVHLALFGPSYHRSVKAIISRF